MERSGNVFVDMGLYVITALVNKNSINDVTIHDFDKALNNIDLTNLNSNTKSFTMIFGNNGPLYQSSFKPHNKELYNDFLFGLLQYLKKDNNNEKYELCEICGDKYNFDINELWNKIITKYNFKSKENKYIGRDFFPLIGSLGNDAQSLPSASRTINICPKCLFAVNFIPLGTMLIKGKLVAFESTSEVLLLELIKDLVHENKTRISAGNKEIYGKAEGSVQLYKKLLDLFSNLQRIKKYENLPDDSALYLWLFSNSGQGANCEIIEIPNKPLQFIWEVSRKSQEFKNEFLNLVANDKKDKLFNSISFGQDYDGLYPKGKYKGVTPEFYEFFQQAIVGKSRKALEFSKKIAIKMSEGKNKNEMSKLQKQDVFIKETKNKNIAKKAMVELILEGNSTYNDYLSLFNIKGKYLKINEFDAYKSIMYYLYNIKTLQIKEVNDVNNDIDSEHMDNKIKCFASLYFHYYVDDKNGLGRGIERFKKDILDRYNEVFDERKLRESFAKLAELYDCELLKLDYDGWIDFITDEDGNKKIYELLFQLRLAFTELYKKYNIKKEGK